MAIPMQLLTFLSSRIYLNMSKYDEYQKITLSMNMAYTVFFADTYSLGNSEVLQYLITLFANKNDIAIFDSKAQLSKETHFQLQIPKNTILFIRDNEVETAIRKLRQNVLWNGRSNILVIVGDKKQVKPWLGNLWKCARAANVTILTMDKQHFFTWNPYEAKQCTTISKIVKVPIEKIFRYQIGNNLHNCPLLSLGHDAIPGNQDPKRGFEMVIISEVAKKLKMNSQLIQIPAHQFLTVWTPDGQPAGFLKIMLENTADLAFGAVQRRFDFSLYTDYMTSHKQDDLCWYAPTPRYYTSIEKLQYALELRLWICILVTLVFVMIGAVVIKKAHSSAKPTYSDLVLYTVVANFGVTIKVPDHHWYKFIFLLLYIYSIHVVTMYQSGLIYMLSNKVAHEPMRIIEDAWKSNQPFIFHEHFRHAINYSGSTIWEQIEKRKLYHFTTTPPTDEMVRTKRGVFLTPSMVMEKKMIALKMYDNDHLPLIFPLKEPFITFPLTFAFAMGHPLVHKIDKVVQKMIESGLTELWYKNYQNKKEISLRSQKNSPLSLDGVSAIFFILSVCLIFSIISFLAELVIRASNSKRNLLNNKTEKQNHKRGAFVRLGLIDVKQ